MKLLEVIFMIPYLIFTAVFKFFKERKYQRVRRNKIFKSVNELRIIDYLLLVIVNS